MSNVSVQTQFFKLLFGTQAGYVCLAAESKIKGDFRQEFFEWPLDERKVYAFIDRWRSTKNLWFCVNLLSRKVRRKEYCLETNLIWSDMDEADPTGLDPPPAIIIKSSPERYQAIWRVDHFLDSYTAEDYSKRLAYYYAENGADPTGWDLTQLLRVPYTLNLKYDDNPETDLLTASPALMPVEFFEGLPEVESSITTAVGEAPNLEDLPTVEEVLKKYHFQLKTTNFDRRWTYEPEPSDNWSELQWNLVKTCMEVGMSPEEAYVVSTNSNFNKYARDKRPPQHLWREIHKAKIQIENLHILMSAGVLEMPELVPGTSYDKLGQSFIDEYRKWGEKSTDAPAQYHDLSAFILLSSLTAGNIRLDTTYGTIRPNLWGLVLGDSTLTRKSTAMRMATEIISFIDKDILVASEGSIEGILSELAMRKGKTSVFFRDEVTGFFDSARKQDYKAGMVEIMTQLYDVPHFFTRRLKKETITVEEPVFIFFGGGIKEKLFSVVDDSYIYSGFFPRFLMVSGDTDLNAIRRTGPPTEDTLELKQTMYARLSDLYKLYALPSEVELLGQSAIVVPDVEAILTPEAWELYGEIEYRMVEAAADSHRSEVALPTFERLSRSLLKMSVLLAAIRQKPEQNYLQVIVEDILQAAKYVQHWGNYSIEVISSVGRTVMIRTLEKVLSTIERNPGITRGQIMRATNLSKREMTDVEETLEERGQIRVGKAYGGKIYTAV